MCTFDWSHAARVLATEADVRHTSSQRRHTDSDSRRMTLSRSWWCRLGIGLRHPGCPYATGPGSGPPTRLAPSVSGTSLAGIRRNAPDVALIVAMSAGLALVWAIARTILVVRILGSGQPLR